MELAYSSEQVFVVFFRTRDQLSIFPEAKVIRQVYTSQTISRINKVFTINYDGRMINIDNSMYL